MRCVLLFLVLSIVFCGDVNIHKVVEGMTGWSEADAKTLDSIADEFTKNGQFEKAKYDERLKYSYHALYQKVTKFRETLQKISNENKAAFGFIDSVLTYAVQTRYGQIQEDEASKKVKKDWDNLAKDVRNYLMSNFEPLKQISHFVGKF
ncbi:hypothetical protein GCK32_017441 [Trichostrongylus colubriformis]|uniref:Uncharacterized protein n=1 Tax=Trichostrongylus colubriformis TaxID=6319 RepID=A0AAN8IQT8_TRICO